MALFILLLLMFMNAVIFPVFPRSYRDFANFLPYFPEALIIACESLCTSVIHNTAQGSSDYLPSYVLDNYDSSYAVCRRRGS